MPKYQGISQITTKKIVKVGKIIAKPEESGTEPLQKERPILFSTPMVKALLRGSKTVTRRIMKPQPVRDKEYYGGIVLRTKHASTSIKSYNDGIYSEICPYGKPGDILWVRESWCEMVFGGIDTGYGYKEEADKHHPGRKWRPSIHMPKKACRIRLQITNVRIEKLNKIDTFSAIQEGIESEFDGAHSWFRNYSDQGPSMFKKNPIKSYKTLWQKINGPKSWKSNPYVWVIEFTVLKNK